MVVVEPPKTEAELLDRCKTIAGCSISDIAAKFHYQVPVDQLHHKGWVGQLLELALGADAGSLAEPDFRSLSIELKTIPVDNVGKPTESTYVAHAPMNELVGLRWDDSVVQRKLARVLWLPIQADKSIQLANRRVGQAILWSPEPHQLLQLKQDWQELVEQIALGRANTVSAHQGTYLQLRPKAANSSVVCDSVSATGDSVKTLPLGFYLRPGFTAEILRACSHV